MKESWRSDFNAIRKIALRGRELDDMKILEDLIFKVSLNEVEAKVIWMETVMN